MSEEWQQRMFCTMCNWNKKAHHDNLFHSACGISGCCPGCGTEIEEHRMNPQWGKPFVLKTVKWVSTSVWYRPSTWETGYWLEKGLERKEIHYEGEKT